MKILSRLCLLGFATVVACSYDASQLAGPPTRGLDGSTASGNGGQSGNLGSGGPPAVDVAVAMGGSIGAGGLKLGDASIATGGVGGTDAAIAAGGTAAGGSSQADAAIGGMVSDGGIFPSSPII